MGRRGFSHYVDIRRGGYLMTMLDYKGRGVKDQGKSDYVICERSLNHERSLNQNILVHRKYLSFYFVHIPHHVFKGYFFSYTFMAGIFQNDRYRHGPQHDFCSYLC